MLPNTARNRENAILACLDEPERYRLVKMMHPIDLPVRTVLYGDGAPIERVVFLTSGVSSILMRMSDGGAVETAMIGSDGVVGLPLFLGQERPGTTAVQQIAGFGLALPGRDFVRETTTSSALRAAVTLFTGVHLTETQQSVACGRVHENEQRCARWILLCADRIGREDFEITHEFLAQMLRAGRSAVSETLRSLERARLIAQSRGHLTIVDRVGLARRACECYEVLRAERARYSVSLCGAAGRAIA